MVITMTDKTPEEIAAAEQQAIKDARASIKVNVAKATETDEEFDAREAKETADENEEVVVTEKSQIEDAETVVEEHEKTEAELEAQKNAAKTDREKDKFQKRIERETGKRKALENEIKELKAKLAAEPDKENALTEEEVEKRAEAKATAKQIKHEFDQATDRLFKSAMKADKDFQGKINALADDIGLIPSHLIGILDDLDNGGDILVHLTGNPDEAQEIYEMNPARAAVKLAKLSAKIETEKKPAPKVISKVPDPTEPIKGSNQSPDILPTNPTKNKESMDKFVRVRAQQEAEKRKARLGLH
jgi:hypothetical protein